MRAMTTLIAVVGPQAEPAVRAVAQRSSNVTFEDPGGLPDDPLECSTQLAAVWRRAARHSSVFTAVPADPLEAVVREWTKRLRGEVHDLETVIGLTTQLPTPDFWLVDDALPRPEIDWYADHLASLAHRRVILTRIDPPTIEDRIGSLPTGRQPEAISEIAAEARGYVPTPTIEVTDRGEPAPRKLLSR